MRETDIERSHLYVIQKEAMEQTTYKKSYKLNPENFN